MNFKLALIDYLLVAAYFIFVVWVGIAFKKKGETSTRSYFLAGGNLPWWLLGTSMVATTFAAGTPFLVAGWAYSSGIAKNWEWWAFLPGAMLTTFFFAKLWRRTGVITDAEYITLRYSGKEANFLRGFRALYMGFIMNALVLGTGLVAIANIGTALLGLEGSTARWIIAIICGGVAMFYSSMSGFAGIVITDFVQFCIATIGTILIAVFACAQPEVGGLSGLVSKISDSHPEHLNLFPNSMGTGNITIFALVLYLSIRWWSQVYGGAEPGGASHVAQRMLASRSEKDAVLGTLWFNIAHYALRPWPWIIAGLAALILFPELGDGEKAYALTLNFLPAGVKGLVVAAFFAAFMSTIDTRLNLGAAYFVNDFYQPFIKQHQSERHYIFVSRIITVAQMACGYSILLIATNLKSLFFLYAAIGSGSGLVYILRWYWWRVSAWSEIAAMSAALIMMLVFRLIIYPSQQLFNANAVYILMISTISVTAFWILITFLTKPSSEEKLKEFYRKIRPAGPFWRPIAEQITDEVLGSKSNLRASFVSWICAVVTVYSMLLGVGKFLLLEWEWGVVFTATFTLSVYGLKYAFKRMNSDG
jgi:solute:Na+ symporter, SSS family